MNKTKRNEIRCYTNELGIIHTKLSIIHAQKINSIKDKKKDPGYMNTRISDKLTDSALIESLDLIYKAINKLDSIP